MVLQSCEDWPHKNTVVSEQVSVFLNALCIPAAEALQKKKKTCPSFPKLSELLRKSSEPPKASKQASRILDPKLPNLNQARGPSASQKCPTCLPETAGARGGHTLVGSDVLVELGLKVVVFAVWAGCGGGRRSCQ